MDMEFSEPVCDFCSEPSPTHTIKCRSFLINAPVKMLSTTDWMACDTCQQLIQSDDLEGLLTRAVAAFRVKYGIGTDIPGWQEHMEALTRQMYMQFWNARL